MMGLNYKRSYKKLCVHLKFELCIFDFPFSKKPYKLFYNYEYEIIKKIPNPMNTA